MPEKVYVCAKSKADLNRRLNNAEEIIGIEYNYFNPNGYITRHIVNTLQPECIVAIFSDYTSDDVPQAKVWGTYMPLRKAVL